MEGYMVIQSQTILVPLFALFLVTVASYALAVWKLNHRVTEAVSRPWVLRQGRESTNQDSFSKLERQASDVADQTDRKDALSFAREWLAPIIVWLIVMAVCLSVAGFLTGEH
jgi:hypothetical protein